MKWKWPIEKYFRIKLWNAYHKHWKNDINPTNIWIKKNINKFIIFGEIDKEQPCFLTMEWSMMENSRKMLSAHGDNTS